MVYMLHYSTVLYHDCGMLHFPPLPVASITFLHLTPIGPLNKFSLPFTFSVFYEVFYIILYFFIYLYAVYCIMDWYGWGHLSLTVASACNDHGLEINGFVALTVVFKEKLSRNEFRYSFLSLFSSLIFLHIYWFRHLASVSSICFQGNMDFKKCQNFDKLSIIKTLPSCTVKYK